MTGFKRSTWFFCLLAAAASATPRNQFDVFSSGRQLSRRGNRKAWVETVPLSNRPLVDDSTEVPRSLVSRNTFASSVSFLTGVADVFGCRMGRGYVNMMTGNSVSMVSALVEMRMKEAFRLGSLLLFYALGNTAYYTMVHLHHAHPKPNETARATASQFILALFALSDYLFYSKTAVSKSLVHAIPLSLGFGLWNACSMDAMGGTITFAMTGHIKTICQGLSDLLFHSDLKQRHWRSAQQTSCRVFGFFLVGVLVGTFLANLGSQQTIVGSGMTFPAFLLEEFNLPVYTLIGILSTILLYLHDHPLPRSVREMWASISERLNRRRDKVQLSVNIL